MSFIIVLSAHVFNFVTYVIMMSRLSISTGHDRTYDFIYDSSIINGNSLKTRL